MFLLLRHTFSLNICHLYEHRYIQFSILMSFNVASLQTLTCSYSFAVKTAVKLHCYPINMNSWLMGLQSYSMEKPAHNGIRRTKGPRLMVCSINLLGGIHCLKCFSHNVSEVESTPVFRRGFVVRMTVFFILVVLL